MKFPLQIQFKDIEESDFVSNAVWDHADKLERFYDRIISCHVTVSLPHQHQHKGNIYHIQTRLHVPGEEIVINSEPEMNAAHKDVYVAIRDAFDATKRRLEDYIRRKRGLVKSHHAPAHGKVTTIFPDEEFGFIRTTDNREIYFHKNSVLDDEFEKLKIEYEVRFSEEMGEKGPQVTSMSLVVHSLHLTIKF